MVELTHNGKRYMVDGGQFRSLCVGLGIAMEEGE